MKSAQIDGTQIISNCPLCEAHGLHVMNDPPVQQCLNCGYVTSEKYIGNKETNREFNKLSDEMQKWSIQNENRIWIPSMITLPFGTLYPINVDEEMKWAFAPMIDIPEEEQENYPDGIGSYYNKLYDTDNQKIFDTFLDAMLEMNEQAKTNVETEIAEIKLPKLKKVDG